MYYSLQAAMIDQDPMKEHSHQGNGGIRDVDIEGLTVTMLPAYCSPSDSVPIPSTDRGHLIPSSDSLPAVPEVTRGWPASVAYDAYHDADFTLAPIHGALQRSGSVRHERAGSRFGRGSSQGLIAKPPPARRVVRGGVFSSPGGLDYQDFSPEVSGFDENGGLECTETFA